MPSKQVTVATASDAKQMTRRHIALAALAAPALPLAARAENPQPFPQQPAPAAAAATDPLQKAQDHVREVSERLRKIEVPMDLEPAFAFRP